MQTKELHSKLELKDFTLPVHLGCEEWERQNTQAVNFQITFGFENSPKAEVTDRLSDSICYAKVCREITKLTKESHFKLVEKLAEDVRRHLIKNFPNHDQLKVRAHKLKPPIDLLTNGVAYTCGDLNL